MHGTAARGAERRASLELRRLWENGEFACFDKNINVDTDAYPKSMVNFWTAFGSMGLGTRLHGLRITGALSTEASAPRNSEGSSCCMTWELCMHRILNKELFDLVLTEE